MNEKERSRASIRREQVRNSPATAEFRCQILAFLDAVNASTLIQRRLQKDLSVMTNMPFYGTKFGLIEKDLSYVEIFSIYVELLISYDDLHFSHKLVKSISVQQDQVLRKIAGRSSEEKQKRKAEIAMVGVFDHAIPVRVITQAVLEMIEQKDISDLSHLLDVYARAGQRYLTRDQDRIVSSRFRSTMPDGWNWRDVACDPLARYAECGIQLV